MQENNIFYKRVNRFSNNISYQKEEYDSFDFNGNLKSDKFEELEFTNYLSSNGCNKYFLLLEICEKINNNIINFNKYFIPDEFDSSKYSSKRVFNIINAINKRNVPKETLIYKFKSKKDPEIQFYAVLDNRVLKLYAIDIYHLIIEAINKKTGKADRFGIYNKRKNCSYDIAEIKKELNKKSDKPRE